MDDFPDEETYPFEPEKYHPIPAKAIILLIKKGRINLPITPDQEQALELLRYVWSEKVFLRFQLAELEKKERLTTAFKMPNDIDRHDSFIQEWVPEKNQYVARVVGLEGDTDAPVAMGFTAGKALENLLADFKMYKQVKHLHIASKLREAIAKKELRF